MYLGLEGTYQSRSRALSTPFDFDDAVLEVYKANFGHATLKLDLLEVQQAVEVTKRAHQ